MWFHKLFLRIKLIKERQSFQNHDGGIWMIKHFFPQWGVSWSFKQSSNVNLGFRNFSLVYRMNCKVSRAAGKVIKRLMPRSRWDMVRSWSRWRGWSWGKRRRRALDDPIWLGWEEERRFCWCLCVRRGKSRSGSINFNKRRVEFRSSDEQRDIVKNKNNESFSSRGWELSDTWCKVTCKFSAQTVWARDKC